jgi:hypothetical protein
MQVNLVQTQGRTHAVKLASNFVFILMVVNPWLQLGARFRFSLIQVFGQVLSILYFVVIGDYSA